MIIALKILTNKWTYIALLFISLFIYIGILNIQKKTLQNEIQTLQNIILENKYTLQQKEKSFEVEKIIISNQFYESYINIKNRIDNKLKDDILNSIDIIQQEFNNK